MNQLQKSRNKLEKLRVIFFQLGLIIACGLTFLAFEWATPYELPDLPDTDIVYEVTDWDVAIPLPEEIKPPEVKIDRPKIIIDPTQFTIVDKIIDKPVDKVKEEPIIPPYNPADFAVVEKVVEKDIPLDRAEKMPEFIGGEKALFKYLFDSTKYPRIEVENNVSGIVYVQFIVGKNGKIRDVKVLRGVSRLLDREAVRVVKAMPDWKPGKQHGKKVSVKYNIPIRFTLRS